MPLIEVFEALLRHYSTGSEAFLRPRFATHIDLVGNFGPGRLKWPFCKIRPRVVVFFKEIGEVPKVVEDASENRPRDQEAHVSPAFGTFFPQFPP